VTATVAATAALVVCDRAGRTFGSGPTAIVAIHGVTCRIEPGQRVALTGPSGSGKSTLLHLIAGLDQPTVGSINWPGIGDRTQLRPGPVAVIFQGPSLLPALDVVENVALPLVLAGAEDDEARREAHMALERLGLDSLGAALPDELSGGQAQRVAVARALAGAPRLILADEPTGQLDHATGEQVIDTLLDASIHSGAALLVTTHDRTVAERLDERWRMVDGRLVRNIAAVPEGESTCSA
jgi:ABC-type lipoprotein export system ATPase subunit